MFLLLACADPTTTGPALTLEDTLRPSVFRAHFETTATSVARLEYGVDDFDHTLDAASEDGLNHNALLAGLGAGETWRLRAVDPDGVAGPEVLLEVPSPDFAVPELVLAEGSDSGAEGFFLLTSAGSGDDLPASVSLVDHSGRRTWWAEGGPRDLLTEAWLVGQTVWWMSFDEASYLRRMDLDGAQDVTLELPELSHSFVVMPDGTIVVVEYDTREVDGVMVRGDRLVRYDADGNVMDVLWSSWDSFIFDPATLDGQDPMPWSHVNSVRYDEASHTLVVTALGLGSAIGLDPDVGGLRWVLGGEYGDLDLSAIPAEHQPLGIHGAMVSPRGVLLFNNRSNATADDYWSEGVEYIVDWETRTVTDVWTYDADRAVFASALGNVEDRPDGRRMVSFGVAGHIVELQDDEVVWQLDTTLGASVGYVHPVEQLAGATR